MKWFNNDVEMKSRNYFNIFVKWTSLNIISFFKFMTLFALFLFVRNWMNRMQCLCFQCDIIIHSEFSMSWAIWEENQRRRSEAKQNKTKQSERTTITEMEGKEKKKKRKKKKTKKRKKKKTKKIFRWSRGISVICGSWLSFSMTEWPSKEENWL
jgi:phosphate/sulfate permease